jgi:hypothetical protein
MGVRDAALDPSGELTLLANVLRVTRSQPSIARPRMTIRCAFVEETSLSDAAGFRCQLPTTVLPLSVPQAVAGHPREACRCTGLPQFGAPDR